MLFTLPFPTRPLSCSNLTSNWADGKLMTLLVNAVAPGLCPGGQQTQPENGLMFLERAMDRAEAWLGVPQVGEHSNLSYLGFGIRNRPEIRSGPVRTGIRPILIWPVPVRFSCKFWPDTGFL